MKKVHEIGAQIYESRLRPQKRRRQLAKLAATNEPEKGTRLRAVI